MKKIEFSTSVLMSLTCLSSSGSEEPEEVEEVEEEITEDEVAETVMSISDEDFEKLSPDDFEKALNDEPLGDEEEEEEGDEEVNEDEDSETADEDETNQTKTSATTTTNQPNEEEQSTEALAEQQKAFELLYGTPIKASGREVQLRNPEHARNFIEMGIDYNKKMHAMKPHMRVLKTLEKEGLLDESKMDRLNLLLEIEKGDKNALKRLISESGIDPLDFADEDAIAESKNYAPQNQMISDQEVEIEEALNSIEGTASQQRTLDVMTKQMDARSREVISENPSYIVALNQDIESGVYDEVMESVQYKRDMRMVPANVSDMELYIQTVQEMSQVNAANQTHVPSIQSEETKPQAKRQQRDPSVRRRKVAMSGTKSSSPKKKREYDPMEVLGMDDEKFMKEMGMDLL